MLSHYEAPRSPIELLPASSVTDHELQVILPKETGEYEMRLTFVHEHVAWWTDFDYPTHVIRIIVRKQ